MAKRCVENSLSAMHPLTSRQARDNKLTIEDMAGGSFTISNGGVFGSMMGTPIINLPQTAVLGLHATKDRAVAINGKVEIRPVCSNHVMRAGKLTLRR